MSEVADGIIARDRKRMQAHVMRIFSFVCAVLSWQVLFLQSPSQRLDALN
jgi:hypothetical protein